MKRSSVVCWLSSLGVAAFFMVGPACAADVHVTRRAGVIGGAGAGVGAGSALSTRTGPADRAECQSSCGPATPMRSRGTSVALGATKELRRRAPRSS